MIKRYVIPGIPTPFRSISPSRRNVWDTQKSIKLSARNHLEYQHANIYLYNGPLILDIDFFFSLPPNLCKSSPHLHIQKPTLTSLIRFVEEVASGVLFDDDCFIAQINATKIYSENPRTEFTLIEIKN